MRNTDYKKEWYKKPKRWAVIIILLFLLPAPFTYFEKVDTNHYGLARNVITGKVDTSQVYETGRHPVGWFVEFIEFPATQRTIEFYTSANNQITGRTQDGLAISLDIAFQYQLQKVGILDLYRNFGTDYNQVFFKIARDITRDIASLYDAIQFFNNRTLIGSVMEDLMIDVFENQHATTIAGFQLLQIDLPQSFDNALENVEIARQEIEKAKFDQQAALIRAETLILEAEANAQVTILEAEAGAEAFLITIEAQAKAVNITLTAERENYYALAQTLGLNSTELLAYLWIQALSEIGEYGNLIIIGDNTPQIILSDP